MTNNLFDNTKTITTAQAQKTIQITHGPSKRFRTPITTSIPLGLNEGQKAVYNYMWQALSSKCPKLIPFAFESQTIYKMARYLKRHLSGSLGTGYIYIRNVKAFCDWTNKTPDQLIADCKDPESLPDRKALYKYSQLLDDFIGMLQENYLAPNTVASYTKGVKCLFQTNGLKLESLGRLSTRVIYKDRAPRPEELQRLIDLGNLREKVVVSWLALGGFRVGTLAKLKYRHIKEDYEANTIPLHVHVPAHLTKGKYQDYDTFIAQEGVTYFKAYLNYRKRGTPKGYMPPETITPDSPLIRNARSRKVKPVEGWQISQIIRTLYYKAGLTTKNSVCRNKIRAHSIRKFFRTQLEALGVNRDYTEYMLGHKVDRYHDIEMKGIDFLRNAYHASGISIRPKTPMNKMERLKEMIRAFGMNPEQILTKQALTMTETTHITPQTQMQELSNALKTMLKKEILDNAKV